MKNIILNRIDLIKEDEDYFESEDWASNYISYTDENNNVITKHISKVKFEKLNDIDLIRVFEYIILCRNDKSKNRVNKTYFK
jgi:hypothetical protein